MGKRLQGIVIGLIVGLFVAGGVAYAVTVIPSDSADRYYACVSTAGAVKSATLKLNVQPASCPSATDTVRSWNAQGPAGAAGAVGPQGAAASAPKNILIHVAGGDVTVPTRVPSGGGSVPGAANYATGIDLSNCRRITSVIVRSDGWTDTSNSYMTMLIQLDLGGGLALDGVSGGSQSSSPGIPSGLYRFYPQNPPDADTGDNLPASTGVLRFTNGSPNTELVIHDAWITCKPYS